MKKRHLFTLLALSLMPLSLSAQSHKISGKVIDSKGDPVVGAIISIKNKTVAITDFD